MNDRRRLSLRLGESGIYEFLGRLNDCNLFEIISKRHFGFQFRTLTLIESILFLLCFILVFSLKAVLPRGDFKVLKLNIESMHYRK